MSAAGTLAFCFSGPGFSSFLGAMFFPWSSKSKCVCLYYGPCHSLLPWGPLLLYVGVGAGLFFAGLCLPWLPLGLCACRGLAARVHVSYLLYFAYVWSGGLWGCCLADVWCAFVLPCGVVLLLCLCFACYMLIFVTQFVYKYVFVLHYMFVLFFVVTP